MKRIFTTFLLSLFFIACTQAQNLNFNAPVKLFDHPLGSPDFNYPFLAMDFNLDGRKDFIGRYPADQVRVYIGTDTGFDLSTDLSIDFYSRPFQVVDFNKDGFDDVLMQSYFLLYDPDIAAFTPVDLDSAGQISGVTIVGMADFDGDGRNDLLTTVGTGSSATDLAIYDWDGTDFIKKPIDNNINLGPIQVGDLEGDGDADIAIIDKFSPNSPVILVNDGTGNFTARAVLTNSILSNSSLDFADLDGDGDMDVLASNIDNQLVIYQNSDNFLTTPTVVTVTNSSTYVNKVVDLDNDGINEIVALDRNADLFNMKVYQSQGQGSLNFNISKQVALITGSSFFLGLNPNYIKNSIDYTDYDSDGDTDLILTFGVGKDPAVFLIENISTLFVNTGSVHAPRQLAVYPNPVQDELNIADIVQPQAQMSYRITNAMGQVVASGALNTATLNVTGLVSGTYVLTVQAGEEHYVATFQKR